MIINSLTISGAFIIDIEQKEDNRGFFARTVDHKEFNRYGMKSDFVQQSISFNLKLGTLRGMHFQKSPFEEEKLIRVTRGSAYYVILDLRIDSQTYKKYLGVELSDKKRNLLYVPKGIALGFITLEDNTEIYYQMTQEFVSDSSAGIRFDDPTFRINWPIKPSVISEKDMNLPVFKE